MTHLLTSDQVKEALTTTNGQPVAAAKLLSVDYTTLYRFIRLHPELLIFQQSARAKTFNELESIVSFAVKSGYVQRSILDQNGNIIGEVELVPIDERTRIDSAFKMMNLYKNDAGIVDEVNVNAAIGTIGSIPVLKWLNINNELSE